jgi:excisionase family DNA binding protein
MKTILTPRELAQAIGVSESSVKRWVDDGSITATKTSGGHRRIAITEAIRFIRDSQSVVVRPEALGLSDITSVAEAFPRHGEETETLFEHLRTGAAEEAKGLLLTLYLNGYSIADIIDGPVRGAMDRMGELWAHDREGIFFEHRATEIVIQSVMRLRSVLPSSTPKATAVGGSAPGDVYRLPTLSAATVIEAAGLEAVNLGPNVPIETLELAADRLQADLVWLSVSSQSVPSDLGDQLRSLAGRLAARHVPLIVGGREAGALGLRSVGNVRAGGSMAELEAIALGMKFSVGHTRQPN